MAKVRNTSLSATQRAARDAAAWHGGWLAVVGLAALAVPPPSDGTLMTLALGLAALPGLVGLLLLRFPGRIDAVLLVLWALCAGAAVMLTGGLTGPFALWSVTPLAAGIVLGGQRRL
ncbi:MAG TPA: sensor histidine kinase, partial [Caulobacteraceae bacterium]